MMNSAKLEILFKTGESQRNGLQKCYSISHRNFCHRKLFGILLGVWRTFFFQLARSKAGIQIILSLVSSWKSHKQQGEDYWHSYSFGIHHICPRLRKTCPHTIQMTSYSVLSWEMLDRNCQNSVNFDWHLFPSFIWQSQSLASYFP